MVKAAVLSVKQPWAWLLTHGIKDVENRKRRFNYRGRLYIHASKTVGTGLDLSRLASSVLKIDWDKLGVNND